MSLLTMAKVVQQQELGNGFFRLKFKSPEQAALARPGQFVQVKCGSTLEPLLRRPISINDVDLKNGEITLLYQVVGRGTTLLSRLNSGDSLDVLGPLGRGFTLPRDEQRVAVVGGGIGVAPLFFLLRQLVRHRQPVHILLGGRSVGQMVGLEQIKELVRISSLGTADTAAYEPEAALALLETATDDGSLGCHGPVTQLLEPLLAERKVSFVYACGPHGMLKTVAGMLARHKIGGEVSLEERMGCGVGACLSCACKTRSAGQDFTYSRVCAEGPVFPVEEVVWE